MMLLNVAQLHYYNQIFWFLLNIQIFKNFNPAKFFKRVNILGTCFNTVILFCRIYASSSVEKLSDSVYRHIGLGKSLKITSEHQNLFHSFNNLSTIKIYP